MGLTMNPEIAKDWSEALKAYDEAKGGYRRGESDFIVRKHLWMAVIFGQRMTKHLKPHGEESLIAAGTALDSLSQLEQLPIRRAFDMVLKALREYHNLMPGEYNLPLPASLDKWQK